MFNKPIKKYSKKDRKATPMDWIVGFMLLLLLFYFLVPLDEEPEKSTHKIAEPVVTKPINTIAPKQCVTKATYPFAHSESDIKKAVSLIVEKDLIALQKLIDVGVIFMLPADSVVYVAKFKMFSGTVKVRRAGSIDYLWSVIEAINCR